MVARRLDQVDQAGRDRGALPGGHEVERQRPDVVGLGVRGEPATGVDELGPPRSAGAGAELRVPALIVGPAEYRRDPGRKVGAAGQVCGGHDALVGCDELLEVTW